MLSNLYILYTTHCGNCLLKTVLSIENSLNRLVGKIKPDTWVKIEHIMEIDNDNLTWNKKLGKPSHENL